MCNGILSEYLLKSQTKPSWEERIKIFLDIDRGIPDLHEKCETQIIHCDINPNILMGESGCAKIAEFGLEKLLMQDHSRTVTHKGNKIEDMLPQSGKRTCPSQSKWTWIALGLVSVVPLVTICYRRSLDINAPVDEIVLVDWVHNCFKANEVRKLCLKKLTSKVWRWWLGSGFGCTEEEPITVSPSMFFRALLQ